MIETDVIHMISAVSLEKQQFAGLHRAVRWIRPLPHTSRSIQPLDLRRHHTLGAWSKVGTREKQYIYFDGYTDRLIYFMAYTAQCFAHTRFICERCVAFCASYCSKEPGQQRVKRWAFGIDEVFKDPVGREQFLKFLESEFSSENLRYMMKYTCRGYGLYHF